MNDSVIERHNFEQAKSELKKFSEQTPKKVTFSRVDETKDLPSIGWGILLGRGLELEHKVTGEEFNKLTTQVQNHLSGVHNTQNKLIKQFKNVYNALEALDKDYVSAILISIKNVEAVSEKVKTEQGKIKRIVADQEKMIAVLQTFKQNLKNCVHLKDIDILWENYLNLRRDVSSLFKENESVIDEIRQSLENMNNKIVQLDERLREKITHIENITSFVEELKTIGHLREIDNLWNKSEQYAVQLENLQHQYDQTKNLIQQNKVQVDQAFIAEKDRTDFALQQLNKKIQYAYWVVGGTITLALVELGLILLR